MSVIRYDSNSDIYELLSKKLGAGISPSTPVSTISQLRRAYFLEHRADLGNDPEAGIVNSAFDLLLKGNKTEYDRQRKAHIRQNRQEESTPQTNRRRDRSRIQIVPRGERPASAEHTVSCANFLEAYEQTRDRKIMELQEVTPDSLSGLEKELRHIQLRSAVSMIREFENESLYVNPFIMKRIQDLDRCVHTSLVNGLRRLGEKGVATDRQVDGFCQSLHKFAKSPEYGGDDGHPIRISLGTARDFLRSQDCKGLVTRAYGLQLTNSLHEVIAALLDSHPVLCMDYTYAHCTLAYSLRRDPNKALTQPSAFYVQLSDPMLAGEQRQALPGFYQRYFTDPLYGASQIVGEEATQDSTRMATRIKVTPKERSVLKTPSEVVDYVHEVAGNPNKIMYAARTAILKPIIRINKPPA